MYVCGELSARYIANYSRCGLLRAVPRCGGPRALAATALLADAAARGHAPLLAWRRLRPHLRVLQVVVLRAHPPCCHHINLRRAKKNHSINDPHRIVRAGNACWLTGRKSEIGITGCLACNLFQLAHSRTSSLVGEIPLYQTVFPRQNPIKMRKLSQITANAFRNSYSSDFLPISQEDFCALKILAGTKILRMRHSLVYTKFPIRWGRAIGRGPYLLLAEDSILLF